jgi:hypothetical protein
MTPSFPAATQEYDGCQPASAAELMLAEDDEQNPRTSASFYAPHSIIIIY